MSKSERLTYEEQLEEVRYAGTICWGRGAREVRKITRNLIGNSRYPGWDPTTFDPAQVLQKKIMLYGNTASATVNVFFNSQRYLFVYLFIYWIVFRFSHERVPLKHQVPTRQIFLKYVHINIVILCNCTITRLLLLQSYNHSPSLQQFLVSQSIPPIKSATYWFNFSICTNF
jgi:hypothetical protein